MQKRIDWKQIFPHTPRAEQVAFIESIDRSLDLNVPAILEGRNGLGKTLAALCGYLQYDGKIAYLTRTHQQVRHVCTEIAEIQKKRNLHFTAVALGSRHRLCLNPHLVYEPVFQKSPVLASHFCRHVFQSSENGRKKCNFIDRDGCAHKLDVDTDLIPAVPELCDVDTLKKFGAVNGVCPYYLGLHLTKSVDVIISPFQYIIDPLLRERIKLNLNGMKIIIDEAHSIPNLCCSILSKRITNYTVQKALGESTGHTELQRKMADIKTLFRQIPTAKMSEVAQDKKYIFGDIFKEILSREGFDDV